MLIYGVFWYLKEWKMGKEYDFSLFYAEEVFTVRCWRFPPYFIFNLSLAGTVLSISCILITFQNGQIYRQHITENAKNQPVSPDIQQRSMSK